MERRKKDGKAAGGNSKNSKENEKNNNSSSQKIRPFTWKKTLQRFGFIILMLVFVYWSSKKKSTSSVKQSDKLERYARQVPCSSDYDKEMAIFKECIPKRCGRIITDSLVTPEETAHLLGVAKKGFSLSSSSGGASILDLHSGAISRGDAFVNVYKLPENDDIFTEEDFQIYRNVKNKIYKKICMEFGILPQYLYLTHPTFFSKMTAKPARTTHDEYWHPHVDKETYPSFHYTSLLYLTDFSEDFNGGRFVFIDRDKNVTIEPRTGRVSMFTSGSENLHHVEKVTSGERYALTVSFSCDKKYAIQDPG